MTKEKKENEGTMFIGGKPFSNYVNGAVMQFNSHGAVRILARGKFISKAVDVAEVLKNRYLEGKAKQDSIKISTSEHKTEDGKDIHVSNIEISLVRV